MSDVSDLVTRIRNGDEDALARFLMDSRAKIERRVRGKLKAAGLTAVDEEDVFSSVSRRMILTCRNEGLGQFESAEQLQAYVVKSAVHLSIDKTRTERTQQRTLQRLRHLGQSVMGGTPRVPDEGAVKTLLLRLIEIDRRMLEMRLGGMWHVRIAAELNLQMPAYRSRWRRMRARAAAILAPPPRQCMNGVGLNEAAGQ